MSQHPISQQRPLLIHFRRSSREEPRSSICQPNQDQKLASALRKTSVQTPTRTQGAACLFILHDCCQEDLYLSKAVKMKKRRRIWQKRGGGSLSKTVPLDTLVLGYKCIPDNNQDTLPKDMISFLSTTSHANNPSLQHLPWTGACMHSYWLAAPTTL